MTDRDHQILTPAGQDFIARWRDQQENPPPTERWVECEMCGCGVAPQAAVYGMPIHGHCFAALTAQQREAACRDHGVSCENGN